MKYDITQPWKSLDKWQEDYIKTPVEQDCFLLCGRQVGKTTAMSIKAVEMCIKKLKKGEFILICSITEKQAYHMLAKAQSYAEIRYPTYISRKKEEKITMHRIIFNNGTGILSFASGETGEGLRGYTIKKLMIDEGSRMGEEFFIAVEPMISVIKGSIDIASTPFGKYNKDGSEKYFYKASKDERFKKWYISAEDCPRHTRQFLDERKERLTKLAYAQEYLAVFTDELKRVFDKEWIKNICILKRRPNIIKREGRYFLGCDVAGLGSDETTLEVLDRINKDSIEQVENIIKKQRLTTQTSNDILNLNESYMFKQIGVDDAGVGFGVWSDLMINDKTKRKTVALNNASRPTIHDGTKSKKLLKEEMYMNLLALGNNKKIKLLDDDEVKTSLESIQHEDGKIFGAYSHVAEGIIRAAWLAAQDKHLNIFIRSF